MLVMAVTALPFSSPGKHSWAGQLLPWSSSYCECTCGIIAGTERPIEKMSRRPKHLTLYFFHAGCWKVQEKEVLTSTAGDNDK